MFEVVFFADADEGSVAAAEVFEGVLTVEERDTSVDGGDVAIAREGDLPAFTAHVDLFAAEQDRVAAFSARDELHDAAPVLAIRASPNRRRRVGVWIKAVFIGGRGLDLFKEKKLFTDQHGVVVFEGGFFTKAEEKAIEAVFIANGHAVAGGALEGCVEGRDIGIVEKEDIALLASDACDIRFEGIGASFLAVGQKEDKTC